jgi:anaerobic magnesium-protoporphyrin IX monomethyl ester cyclase
MIDVLFGQSYYLRFDPTRWAAGQPYPPLGTLYAASVLRERGYRVALFDAMLATSEAEWALALDRFQPALAVLFDDHFNYLSKMCLRRMRQAALTMIEAARRRGCVVIVSSADACDHPELYLAGGADFVILGEGERTLSELADRLSGRRHQPFEAIAGLAYLDPPRSETATRRERPLVRTAPRAVLRDLDTLPSPAWDLVDLARYRVLWRARHGYWSLNFVTTRGCPYHCNWCAKPIWGQQYHVHSPDRVVDELAAISAAYGPDEIAFVDDIFGLKPGWIGDFAHRLHARGLRLRFRCLSRADLLLRPGEIEALARAGCTMVWIGAESGSQRILDAMEKGIRVDQIREATARLHRAGIAVGFFLQFGYPGETPADIEQTLALVRECRPDDLGISVSYPLPGTPFYARVRATLAAKQNWEDSGDLAMLYRGPCSTRFYRRLHRAVHAEFRARQAWRLLRGAPAPPLPRPLGRLRAAARLLRYGVAWPLARWAAGRAARAPQDGPDPVPSLLTPTEAARPTPQQ